MATVDEMQELKKLFKISKSIKSIYDKFYQLEINGNLCEKKYNKILNYLDVALDVENEEINKFSFNSSIILLDIYENIKNEKLGNDFDMALKNELNSLILNRVISRIIKKYKLLSSDYDFNPHVDFLSDLRSNNLSINSVDEVCKDKIFDYILSVLVKFINIKTSKLKDIKLKKQYIKFKYNLIYLNQHNEFNLFEKVFLDCNPEMDYYTKNIYYSELAMSEIEKLDCIEDKNIFKNGLCELYLRSILYSMDTDFINELKYMLSVETPYDTKAKKLSKIFDKSSIDKTL